MMILLIITITLFIESCLCFQPIINNTLDYNVTYSFNITNDVERILGFHDSNINNTNIDVPPTIWISSNASISTPLMIVARQPKRMLSWQLPMVVESESGEKAFQTVSRTLCHDIVGHSRLGIFCSFTQPDIGPLVSVSTASSENVEFSIRVSYQDFFYLDHQRSYNFNITPSEPRYFYYNFTPNALVKEDSNYETVILEVNSDDEICMTVSIQNVSCPVFDTNQDVTFRGFYETVNKKGGITIPKYKFPYGFYVVFVAKPDDFQCTSFTGFQSSNMERIKNISLIIKPSITYSEYVRAIFMTLAAIGAFYVVFGLSYFLCSVRGYVPRQMAYAPDNFPSTPSSSHNIQDAESVSVDESEYDTLDEVETDSKMRLGRGNPYLTDLARKHPKILIKRSYLYFYNVLTVAVFYGLPVVQLVVTYQRVLNQTGQQDLCYYNFLCAHPLGLLSDFNHVFSNIAYILLGTLFLIITCIREKTHKDMDFDRQFGIPQHYGLFYAMGVALIMEGILSGSYHVCPNQLNFQFDSSFMYVMAVLCMVKLYQNRHPDINASAYSTFGILALAVLLGMIGILEGNIYFWRFFVVVHILMCLYVSIKVYYMGCWKITRVSMRGMYNSCVNDFRAGPLKILIPCHKARFILLFVGNICNWALAFFALYSHPKNFAIFLLAVFLANTMLYFVFYIIMKYINKEKVRIVTWIFLTCSAVCAISAMYFFLHKAVSWSRTAAQSRQYNMECALLRFYDFHDIWHFLSAIGMFFTFMVLLTLDDDLSHTHHSQIPVF
nr:unnamed protein product [Callosobruchus chinensis]